MANRKKAVDENVEGNFFVDDTCINCGVSRHFAPDIFGDSGDYAYVRKQPTTAAEAAMAIRSLLSCPTGSIRTRDRTDLVPGRDSLPLELADNIFVNGYTHRASFGANSYFIRAKTGNWLIDSPRYLPVLAQKFGDLGGIEYILLTHRDDVCDAHRYARHFGAKRIIHRLELQAQPDAEIVIDGDDDMTIDAGEIHVVPGHTEGHIVLLWDTRFLFTGDHFAWLPARQRFGSFRDYCWYSWERQIESVEKMRQFSGVEWVLPGHGRWHPVEPGLFPQVVDEAVQWMRSG